MTLPNKYFDTIQLPTARDENGRIAWLDFAKVMAMVVVMFFHAEMTAYGGSLFEFGHFLPPSSRGIFTKFLFWIFIIVSAFHMNVFFAVAGAGYALGSGGKESLKDLTKKKIRRLIVPFILFGLLVKVPAVALFASGEHGIDFIPRLVVSHLSLDCVEHLWFLISLFLCFTVFRLLLPLYRKSPAAFWAVAIAIYYSQPIWEMLHASICVVRFALHFPFFCLGYAIMSRGRLPVFRRPSALAISWVSAILIFHTLWFIPGGNSNLVLFPLIIWIFFNICSTLRFLFGVKSLQRNRIYCWLRDNIFSIYLVSTTLALVLITLTWTYCPDIYIVDHLFPIGCVLKFFAQVGLTYLVLKAWSYVKNHAIVRSLGAAIARR